MSQSRTNFRLKPQLYWSLYVLLFSGLASTLASPPVATNFTGALDNNTFSPPSIAAAAGTNHLVLAVNSELLRQDKAGNVLSTETLASFWTTSRIGINGRVFGSKLIYDDSADRWVMTACANPQTPGSSLLLAVSTTSDPTQTWFTYSIDIDSTNTVWGDVGGLGFNDNWIVVTKNLRTMSGNAFSRSRVYVFDKTQLYGNNPVPNITSTNVLLDVIDDFTTPSLIPAACRDAGTTDMFLMANGQGNDGFGNGSVRLFRLTSTTNQVFSLNQIAQPVGQAPWDDQPLTTSGNFLPQKDSASTIHAGDSRIQNLELRGGSLWCAQTVFLPAGSGTRSAAQWWEISTSGTVVQFGRVDDSSGERFFAYPSIAVNRDRSVLLGYSSFSANQNPSASYSFRFDNEPVGVLQSEVIYKSGEAPYAKTDFSSGLVRWGDYSATMIDPANDQDLWTVQQYASTPVAGIDRWGTHWGLVKLSTPPDGIFEVTVDPPSGALIRAGSSQVFRVSVFDNFPVTNAVVKVTELGGLVAGKTFQNNGLPPDATANDNIYTTTINTPPTTEVLTNVFSITSTGTNSTELLITNVYTVAPPPLNDFFVNAFKIPDRLPETNGVVIGGNFFASTEVDEPVHAGVGGFGNSVWWNWAPVSSGPVLIDTLGSQFNTVLAVYTNNTIDQLGVVAAANDVTNQFGQFLRDKAFVTFNAVAGQTYRIAVAGASTNEFGQIRLRMAFNGQPDTTPPLLSIDRMIVGGLNLTIANGTLRFGTTNLTVVGTDLNAKEIVINDRNEIILGPTNLIINATNIVMGGEVFSAASGGDVPSGFIINKRNVWFVGSASDTGASGSGVSQVLLTGNDGIAASAVGSNSWFAPFALASGSNLVRFTAIDIARNIRTKELAVVVRAFDPVNDIFANAQALGGTNGSVQFNNLNATFEGNEPPHANKTGGHSVWFSYTPTTNGLLTLRTTNSAIDTLLALYSGERINELVTIGANDDVGPNLVHSALTLGVAGGTKYRIAVDGLGGARGAITLHYSFEPTVNRTVTVNTTTGGTVQPGTGLFQQGSVVTLTARTNSGFNFISWTGSVVSVENPISFTVGASDIDISAVFGRRAIVDDFESGGFDAAVGWSNSPGGNWSVEAATAGATNTVFGGSFFARTGTTGNNATNELVVVRELRAGEGGFSFKVSSESFFDDRFEFLVDNTVYLTAQGENDWAEFRTNFPAGVHTLRWRYIKDEAHASGLDAAFIDNIDLPFLESVSFGSTAITDTLLLSVSGRTNRFVSEAVINPRFSRHMTNEFMLRVEGQTNQLYVIQGSSDLANWVSLSTNHAPFGIIEYSDTNVMTQPFRYYRAIIPFATNAAGRVVPTSF